MEHLCEAGLAGVDQLLSCDLDSVKVDILSRYCKFVSGLGSSPSMEVAVMSAVARQDIRTVTGSNVALVRRETGMEPTLCSLGGLKKELRRNIAIVPDMDRWRVQYLSSLLSDRGEAHYTGNEWEVEKLSVLIDNLSELTGRFFLYYYSH